MRATVVVIALATGCTVRGWVLRDRDGGQPPPPDDTILADATGDPVGPAPRAQALSAGQYHTCVALDGAMACWGDNAAGGLGTGDSMQRDAPAGVRAPPGITWARPAAGDGATCASDTAGAVWCWGRNADGELAQGDTRTTPPRATPVAVALPRPVTALAMHFDHACAVLDDGALWCWGANFEGQLGQADGPDAPPTPTPVRVGAGNDWVGVSTGQGHTCGLRRPGTLWCWGRNTDGQLGLGAGAPPQTRAPSQVGTASDWVAVAAAMVHTCALRIDGTLWCWGRNAAGQLGLPGTTLQSDPVQVGAVSDWDEVAVGTFNTCARRRTGALYCWGRNDEGQLGVGDTRDRDAVTQVGADTDWAEVAVGWFHVCARKSDGTVWCTGEDNDGQLGLGDTARRDVLTRVSLAVP